MESARIRSEVGSGEWSIYGALLFLVSSIAASIVFRGVAAVIALAYVVAWCALMSPDAVRCLKRRRFWFFVASITVVSALAMGGEGGIALAGITL